MERERERGHPKGHQFDRGQNHNQFRKYKSGSREYQPRKSNVMVWKKLEKVAYTVFVDNLPTSMTRDWLWQLFQYEGEVVDVFMSRKQRKSSTQPFAFVRFSQLKGAQKAIDSMHGLEVRGSILSVKMAEYKRSEIQRSDSKKQKIADYPKDGNIDGDKTFVGQRSFRDVVMGESSRQGLQGNQRVVHKKNNDDDDSSKFDKTRVVYGETNVEFVQELQRSLVGETLKPLELAVVGEDLMNAFPNIESIREMGAYKMLITFCSMESRDEALNERDEILKRHFDDIRVWSSEETCQTRRVWVEVFGVPLQAWTPENFKRIGEQWGTVVRCDNRIMQKSSFNSALILMDTCNNPYIQGSVYFSIEGNGYDIFVKEVARCRSEQETHVEDPLVMDYNGGKQTPASATERKRHNRQHPILYDVSKPMMTQTAPLWGMTNVINDDSARCMNVENQVGGNNGQSLSGIGSQTIGLEDDRRTEEVLRDLGLIQSSPNDKNILAKAYRQWAVSAASEDAGGPQESGPSKPPGYERIESHQAHSETCSHVPESLPNPQDASEASDDEQSDKAVQSEGQSDREEASETWRTGLKLGLSTEHDGDTLQAIYEERKEWKRGNKKETKKKKRKGRERKERNNTGESTNSK